MSPLEILDSKGERYFIVGSIHVLNKSVVLNKGKYNDHHHLLSTLVCVRYHKVTTVILHKLRYAIMMPLSDRL